ncbi:WPP domain-containing protein 2 [Raphanus sativus]|uniref:WPP domain-containing protein 2 n=1 Tax=Raphanus sativus TaxID=3726 RepID=A0A6J0KJ64_RAPSA|nr:WPP domain-containing protein 2 [Raphanus sativus]KAJ4881712.1 WPP domain-containing protein 2 [Raphanus sativus]
MAETISTTVSPPHSESEGSTTTLPATTTTPDQTSDETSKAADLKKEDSSAAAETKPGGGGISLRIWPPTQKTRDAVLRRLIETLSTESILSKRYGTLSSDEASAVAKSIEEEAYGVASNAVSDDDDGIKILEVYSKEISKRMLETVKDRSAAATANKEAVEDVKTDDAATEVSKDDEAPESEKSEA